MQDFGKIGQGVANLERLLFEFGSGGSTLFLASRCASVESVEDDTIWAGLVEERAAKLGLTSVNVRRCPFDFNAAEQFEESAYLAEVSGSDYDVIVVDGADNDFTIRPRCFRLAENQVRPGGIIIVDDSWRYTALRNEHRAKRVEVFESVGPARFGVTSTDIYFY